MKLIFGTVIRKIIVFSLGRVKLWTIIVILHYVCECGNKNCKRINYSNKITE